MKEFAFRVNRACIA